MGFCWDRKVGNGWLRPEFTLHLVRYVPLRPHSWVKSPPRGGAKQWAMWALNGQGLARNESGSKEPAGRTFWGEVKAQKVRARVLLGGFCLCFQLWKSRSQTHVSDSRSRKWGGGCWVWGETAWLGVLASPCQSLRLAEGVGRVTRLEFPLWSLLPNPLPQRQIYIIWTSGADEFLVWMHFSGENL